MRDAQSGTHQASDGFDHSAAELFALIWHALADVLGTAAAATLLRRAAQRATAATPELLGLEISSGSLEYEYRVPNSWNARSAAPPRALYELVRELWALLVELTGGVVVARLLLIAELREHGIVPPGDRQP